MDGDAPTAWRNTKDKNSVRSSLDLYRPLFSQCLIRVNPRYGFAFPISAMPRDVGDSGDPTPQP
jgi:hypothetical protein